MSRNRALLREEARQAQNTCPTIQAQRRADMKLQGLVNRQWFDDDWDLAWESEAQ